MQLLQVAFLLAGSSAQFSQPLITDTDRIIVVFDPHSPMIGVPFYNDFALPFLLPWSMMAWVRRGMTKRVAEEMSRLIKVPAASSV